MVGGLAGGWCADRFGRKRALLLNNVLLVVGAAFLTFAKHSGVFYLFQLGRLIIGVNAGRFLPGSLNLSDELKKWWSKTVKEDSNIVGKWSQNVRKMF
jgi:MFS family permease